MQLKREQLYRECIGGELYLCNPYLGNSLFSVIVEMMTYELMTRSDFILTFKLLL